MRLFIIGNGFDLGHGLPTKYWDFRAYLEKYNPDFLQSFEKLYDLYPMMSDEEKQNLLWSRFESNLANIDEDSIIDSCTDIDLALESGDIDIEDTLYHYFSEEYCHIDKLSTYLKQWVRTIRIRDCLPCTSLINRKNGDQYITFNYTAVLEKVYGIPSEQIIHIHGSLRNHTADPVIGHGNRDRIQAIQEKLSAAEDLFDEKAHSICRVVENYYKKSFKNISEYSTSLYEIDRRNITEIDVIGHSLDDTDIPYFSLIDSLTGRNLQWTIYVFKESEAGDKKARLTGAGISSNRIQIIPSEQFYDLPGDDLKSR